MVMRWDKLDFQNNLFTATQARQIVTASVGS